MIVKMSKLSIVGLMEERSAIVKRLMKLGVVQLTEIPMTDEEKIKALEFSQFDDATKRIAEIDEELRKIQLAITFLSENTPKVKAKAVKKELSYESFVNAKTYHGIWEKVFEANDLQKRLNSEKNTFASLQNEKRTLELWQGLELPVDFSGTSTTSVLNGTIPSTADIDKLLKTIEETGYAVVNIIREDVEQTYLSLIFHKSVHDKISNELKMFGFTKSTFSGLTGSISDNLKMLDERILQVQQSIDELLEKAAKKNENLYAIQMLYDYIFNMQERRKVRHCFLKTDTSFIVGGWTPSDTAEFVKREIEKDANAYVEISEPLPDDETPVLLKNNSLVYPFEMITEMYSLPASKGIDPNTVMAPFYWFFFGMMLSDAGYGIFLSLLCGFAIWKLKTEKGSLMDKMLKMLFLCGISTTLWGVAFGGWFGDLPLQLFGGEIPPLWFNPNIDPMKLLVWSFIFGAIHLLAGMALNAYMLIRDGKWLDAIFDVGFWYLVLIGVGLLFFGGTVASTGKYMALAGAAGLVLTQGRHEKNIFKKFISGVLSLYNITGYLSDVLSYSRLLALGLATGVVGQVINQLGLLSSGGLAVVLSTIILTIVLIGGHIFNMAINTLGAYVHSSRLQYVEFFGKFYESGGNAFLPLKAKTKYLKINHHI